MRLIGIKLNKGDSLVIKNLEPGGWYPFGMYVEPTAENGWTWQNKTDIGYEKQCNEMYRTILKSDIAEGISITVNCIVGKNGSGKSTLLDILYRIINNFAYKLIDCQWKENQPENNPQRGHQLVEANGFDAILYYEADGCVGSIRYYYGKYLFSYHADNESARVENVNLEKLYGTSDLNKILRHFFYTIGTNYSIHSLNCDDYRPSRLLMDNNYSGVDGSWLKGLYHKNDGYITPIVMTPFRDEHGTIDIERENELAKQRLTTLAVLFASQKKYFMDSYIPNKLVYRYDRESEIKYNKRFNDLFHNWLPLNKDCTKVKRSLKSVWKKELRDKDYQYSWYNIPENVRNAILAYLVYKTLKTCLYYRKYGETLGLYSKCEQGKEANENAPKCLFFPYDKNRLQNVVDIIGKFGILCRCFLPLIIQHGRFLCGGSPSGTATQFFMKMPPAIFEWDMDFKKVNDKSGKTETLTTMSSGEKQLMHSFSYILYHIKNIQSVTDDSYRIKYHNITLIFDEAELYYHPEYQRNFITTLIRMLSWCHMDGRGIRGINIVVVTHSPFVLSDVPLQHTLYMEDGKQVENAKQTYGGNIHELLGANFFMDYSIGEVARTNIEEIIYLYNESDKQDEIQKNMQQYRQHRQRYKYIVGIVADEYLKQMITRMLCKCESVYMHSDSSVHELEEEINQKREELAQLEIALAKMKGEL